jgi:hypothetical protein
MVERWKIIDGGNAIEAIVTFEDPGRDIKPLAGNPASRRPRIGQCAVPDKSSANRIKPLSPSEEFHWDRGGELLRRG